MKILTTALALSLAGTAGAWLQASEPAAAGVDAREARLLRGEYLVHHVAMCVQCHTPRDERHDLVERELLEGAPMPVASPWERVTFAVRAPDLAGLPGGFSEQELAEFLQTGLTPTGHRPEPPMPDFRMNAEDARAVAAYLSSIDGE